MKSENPVEILIADDEEARRSLMREALVKAGYAVVVAKNGEDALEKFLKRRPDAVFLDTSLSTMDGFAVCRSIRRMPGGAHLPILLVTENGEEAPILRAFEAGATDFICRPVDGTVLGYRARFLLRTSAKLRGNEARLNYLAYHDALTGLPNRLLLQDRFQHAVAKAHRSGRKVALLFLDLDQFKRINDSLGHATGDQLLRQVAERLRCGAREEDTLARFGGDEFVFLLEDVPRADTVGIVAGKILSSLAPAFEVKGCQLFTSASIGLAVYPDNGESLEELLRCADIAMYRAKELGRNTFRFFDPGID